MKLRFFPFLSKIGFESIHRFTDSLSRVNSTLTEIIGKGCYNIPGGGCVGAGGAGGRGLGGAGIGAGGGSGAGPGVGWGRTATVGADADGGIDGGLKRRLGPVTWRKKSVPGARVISRAQFSDSVEALENKCSPIL